MNVSDFKVTISFAESSMYDMVMTIRGREITPVLRMLMMKWKRKYTECNRYFVVLFLTPLSAIFQLYHGDQF